MTKRTLLKNDKYRKARGGHSRLLELSCSQCGAHLFYYQKDGAGILKRTYLDRISGDSQWSKMQFLSLSKIPNLICQKCKALIGIPAIYKKEQRLSFHLLAGTVMKKRVSKEEV